MKKINYYQAVSINRPIINFLSVGLLGLVLFALNGCTEQWHNAVVVQHLARDNTTLKVSLEWYNLSPKQTDELQKRPAKQLLCTDQARPTAFILGFPEDMHNGQMHADLKYYSDARLNHTLSLPQVIHLRCHLQFSHMLGGVIKSSDFYINPKA